LQCTKNKQKNVRAELATELAKHQQEAKVAIKRAEEESAKHQEEAEAARKRADEAESIMVAMNAEAEALNKDLATAAEENARLLDKLSTTTGEDNSWSWKALEGVWLSEPDQQIQWIDGASGGVWSKDGQWAKIVEYAGGFALLPTSETTCRGELLRSVRGSVVLWQRKGAWVKQSESVVSDAWNMGSHQLFCPSGHHLRWGPTSSAHTSNPGRPSKKSCKRWDLATQMLTACSACNFPVGSTESGMWQCRGCRYNVCGSCATTAAPLTPSAHNVYPFEVPLCESFTCAGCSGTCGTGSVVVGNCVSGGDRYLCLPCFSTFLMQS